MCAVMPQTETEMLTVKGIGESKLAKYGAQFLAIIQANQAEKSEMSPNQWRLALANL